MSSELYFYLILMLTVIANISSPLLIEISFGYFDNSNFHDRIDSTAVMDILCENI